MTFRTACIRGDFTGSKQGLIRKFILPREPEENFYFTFHSQIPDPIKINKRGVYLGFRRLSQGEPMDIANFRNKKVLRGINARGNALNFITNTIRKVNG